MSVRRKTLFNTLSNHDNLKVVSDIDVTKATSCQNIPTKLFKENIDLYIDVIGRIFNQGTIECKFPDRLKLADITPSYKKGDVTDKNNYRPITLRTKNFGHLNFGRKIFGLKFSDKNYGKFRTNNIKFRTKLKRSTKQVNSFLHQKLYTILQ